MLKDDSYDPLITKDVELLNKIATEECDKSCNNCCKMFGHILTCGIFKLNCWSEKCIYLSLASLIIIPVSILLICSPYYHIKYRNSSTYITQRSNITRIGYLLECSFAHMNNNQKCLLNGEIRSAFTYVSMAFTNIFIIAVTVFGVGFVALLGIGRLIDLIYEACVNYRKQRIARDPNILKKWG